ncbi:hypothetical protein AB7C87_01620 [Natrarchaeobius sp. A-rgal3]|uniref:hypothetical protein n=1 Tax=Natrarchaeobius versutus TaxID=1679078 RepID=UPI003510063A
MQSLDRALLVGSWRRGFGLVGGYAVVAAAVIVASVALGRPIESVGAAILLFYGPGLAATIGVYARCGVPAGLAVGAVPIAVVTALGALGNAFGFDELAIGNGDSTFVAIALGFAVTGLAIAAIGTGFGIAARAAADRARDR